MSHARHTVGRWIPNAVWSLGTSFTIHRGYGGPLQVLTIIPETRGWKPTPYTRGRGWSITIESHWIFLSDMRIEDRIVWLIYRRLFGIDSRRSV